MSKGLNLNDLNFRFYHTERFVMKCKIPNYNPRRKHLSILKHKSLFFKGPNHYNVIPDKIKLAKTLHSFKINLHKILNKIPNNPELPNYIGRNNDPISEWVTGSNDHMTGWINHESNLREKTGTKVGWGQRCT